jgi:hypothetical protein
MVGLHEIRGRILLAILTAKVVPLRQIERATEKEKPAAEAAGFEWCVVGMSYFGVPVGRGKQPDGSCSLIKSSASRVPADQGITDEGHKCRIRLMVATKRAACAVDRRCDVLVIFTASNMFGGDKRATRFPSSERLPFAVCLAIP